MPSRNPSRRSWVARAASITAWATGSGSPAPAADGHVARPLGKPPQPADMNTPRVGTPTQALDGRRAGTPSHRPATLRIGGDRRELAAHRAPAPPLGVAALATARAAIGIRHGGLDSARISASRPARSSSRRSRPRAPHR
jgi:hypothetical protein